MDDVKYRELIFTILGLFITFIQVDPLPIHSSFKKLISDFIFDKFEN